MNASKKMGFGMMLLAGFFLWNPVVGVFDFLPDVIGYLLLTVGAAKLSDLNDDIAESQKAFRAMIWVGIIEILSGLLIGIVLKNSNLQLNRYEKPVWIMLFAFLFMVLELYFMIPAWKKYFHGLSNLSAFYHGTAGLAEKKGKTQFERVKTLTLIFITVRSVLTFLPEAAAFSSYGTDPENPHYHYDWYNYNNLFRLIAASIVTVVGIIWLVRFVRLMLELKKDQSLQENLGRKYETEILPDTGLLVNRRIREAFSFFRVGMVFNINLSIMFFQFLPDWFSYGFVICGCLILGKLMEKKKAVLITGGAVFGVGVAGYILNAIYLKKYVPEDAWHFPEAYSQYAPIRYLGFTETVLMCVFALLLLKSVLHMNEQYTSVNYGEDAELLSRQATERVHRAVKNKAIPTVVFLCLSAVCKLAEIQFQPMVEWLWLAQFAVSLTATVLFSVFLDSVAECFFDSYPAL